MRYCKAAGFEGFSVGILKVNWTETNNKDKKEGGNWPEPGCIYGIIWLKMTCLTFKYLDGTGFIWILPQDPTTWVHPSWSLLWSVHPLDVDPGEIYWAFSAFEFVAENMGIFSSTDGSEWDFSEHEAFCSKWSFFLSGRITFSCMIFVEHPIWQKPCARDEGATDGGWNTGTWCWDAAEEDASAQGGAFFGMERMGSSWDMGVKPWRACWGQIEAMLGPGWGPDGAILRSWAMWRPWWAMLRQCVGQVEGM